MIYIVYIYIWKPQVFFSFQPPFHCQAGADRVVATEVPEIPWGFQIKFHEISKFHLQIKNSTVIHQLICSSRCLDSQICDFGTGSA